MTAPTEPLIPTRNSSLAPFIVFEGLDGSGKSTLIQGVSLELKRQKLDFVLTREPGGTPFAEEIRHLLLRTGEEAPVAPTEVLLYAASRAQHVARVIRPALEQKRWVMCDRFSASMVAFQCFGRSLKRADIDWLNHFAEQGHKPDLYILLDLTVEESQRRQNKRVANKGQASDRMEQESEKFHEAVRGGYLAQAKEDPNRWLVLNAALDASTLLNQTIQYLKDQKWLAS